MLSNITPITEFKNYKCLKVYRKPVWVLSHLGAAETTNILTSKACTHQSQFSKTSLYCVCAGSSTPHPVLFTALHHFIQKKSNWKGKIQLAKWQLTIVSKHISTYKERKVCMNIWRTAHWTWLQTWLVCCWGPQIAIWTCNTFGINNFSMNN